MGWGFPVRFTSEEGLLFYMSYLDRMGIDPWVPEYGLQFKSPHAYHFYLRWSEHERFMLQSNHLLDDPLQKQPMRVWRTPKDGEAILAADQYQKRWLQCAVFLDPHEVVEIPLLDSNGRPLIDPLRIPMITVRAPWPNSVDEDYVGAAGTVTWADQMCNVRSTDDWGVTTSWHAETAQVFLARDPVPHLVLRVSHGFVKASDYWSNEPRSRTILVDLLGVGHYVPSFVALSDGSSGVSGHYEVRTGWDMQQELASPTVSEWNQILFGNGQLNGIASGGTGTQALTGNYAAPITGFVPVLRTHAITLPGIGSVGTTESNWVADTRHRGMIPTPIVGADDPPLHGPNQDEGNFFSRITPSGSNWTVTVHNESQIGPRCFGIWLFGRRFGT